MALITANTVVLTSLPVTAIFTQPQTIARLISPITLAVLDSGCIPVPGAPAGGFYWG